MKIIPITKPTLSPYKTYEKRFQKIVESGILTNGRHVRELEKAICDYTNTKYCIAVSSCTAGLMLVIKGLGLRGEVILPSFTFSASGHAVLWNNLKPVFADIKLDTYEIDPESIERLITPKTSAILATHIFGNPCNAESLNRLTKKHNLRLIFDAAHGLGSRKGSQKIGGFGDAEVFSCSPTKLLTTAEGGLITTNNKELAEFCRIGRNYGDDGSYDTKFNGLNARMTEFNAAIGLSSLKQLDKNVSRRNRLGNYLIREIKKIDPTIQFQKIEEDNTTTYKDFSIFIDPAVTGYHRDRLHTFLDERGIITKKYFYPPLHQQITYAGYQKKSSLKKTELISSNVLSLPLYSHMTLQEANLVLKKIKDFYAHIQRNK